MITPNVGEGVRKLENNFLVGMQKGTMFSEGILAMCFRA